jgi:hypothetical protein
MSCFHQRGGTRALINLHRASIAYTNAVGFAMHSLIPLVFGLAQWPSVDKCIASAMATMTFESPRIQ